MGGIGWVTGVKICNLIIHSVLRKGFLATWEEWLAQFKDSFNWLITGKAYYVAFESRLCVFVIDFSFDLMFAAWSLLYGKYQRLTQNFIANKPDPNCVSFTLIWHTLGPGYRAPSARYRHKIFGEEEEDEDGGRDALFKYPRNTTRCLPLLTICAVWHFLMVAPSFSLLFSPTLSSLPPCPSGQIDQ